MLFLANTSALLLWLMWWAFSAIDHAYMALRHLRSSRSQLSAMIGSAMDAIYTNRGCNLLCHAG